MNIFDQILASGCYVFDGKVNSHIVRMAITFLRKYGLSFSRDELKMQEMIKYLHFDINSRHYVINDGYDLTDLADFIDINLITLFHNLKKVWDYNHTRKIGVEEPSFESAMKKIMREMPMEHQFTKVKRYNES